MIKKLNRIRAEKGFTLAELLVVILIIAILATLAIVFFSGQTDSAKDSVASANARSAYSAAQAYYTDNNGNYGDGAALRTYIGQNSNLAVVSAAPADGEVQVTTSNSGGDITILAKSGNSECEGSSDPGPFKVTC